MSDKLQFTGQSGITAVAIIRDRSNDKVWDGSELVTYVDGDFDDYKVSLTELGHGYYSVAVPGSLPAGRYHVSYYDTTYDEAVFQANIIWNGEDVTEELNIAEYSATDICNMALSHLSHSSELANFETDQSAAAEACRRFYGVTRDTVLRAFPWPFAHTFADLALVAENPNDRYDYSYRYPSSVSKVIRIYSGLRMDTRQSRETYKIGRDGTGLLIYTDKADAEIEYTFKETDPARYPSDFIMAFSHLLAANIAPRITAGNKAKYRNDELALYKMTILEAQANAAGEEQMDEEPVSEIERSRE